MAGTIRKTKNSFRLEYMFNRERYSKTIHTKDKKTAQLEMARFIEDIEKGVIVNNGYTLSDYSFIWLKDVVLPNCVYSTTRKYVTYLNTRILTVLGSYKLKDINVILLRQFTNELKNSTTLKGDRKLANATIRKTYKILSAIMQNAFEAELIPNNPCKKVRLKLEEETHKDNIHFYDEKTYNKVLGCLKNYDDLHRALVETALKTGFRRSELFGLTWDNIDFNKKTITVNKTRHYVKGKGMVVGNTKTKSSKRTVAVPDSLLETLDRLERKEFIFEDLNIDTDTFYWFKKFQQDNKIPVIRFHDLRHTHAVYLLLKGVDIKTISSRLGHSGIKITADVYLHFLKELDKKVSELLE